MMKKFVFILISLAVFSSCSLLKRTQKSSSQAKTEQKPKTSSAVQSPEARSARIAKAVFHLIDPLGLELTLTSLDKKQRDNIFIDKTLSQVQMDPGEWQITGFSLDGKKFDILDYSKHFSFKTKPHKSSYAGSIIVQCPTVGAKHFQEMKKMSFFNRLSFRHGNNLCEMVVGNQFRTVKKVWSKITTDNKSSKLILGF